MRISKIGTSFSSDSTFFSGFLIVIKMEMLSEFGKTTFVFTRNILMMGVIAEALLS